MIFQMLRSTKFPRVIGITLGVMTAKIEEGIHRKTNTTKVKRISTRNHGKTRTKNCGTKIIRSNMVTRSPKPKMLALPLLKMLSIFAPQVLTKVYLMQ